MSDLKILAGSLRNLMGYGDWVNRLYDADTELDQLRAELKEVKRELDELAKDKARLDWLDSMSDGRCWEARQSTTGRGYRVHNSSGGHKMIRDAIDHATLLAAKKGDSLRKLTKEQEIEKALGRKIW